ASCSGWRGSCASGLSCGADEREARRREAGTLADARLRRRLLPPLRAFSEGPGPLLSLLGRPQLPDGRAHALRDPARQSAARLRLRSAVLPDAPASLPPVRPGAVV